MLIREEEWEVGVGRIMNPASSTCSFYLSSLLSSNLDLSCEVRMSLVGIVVILHEDK